MDHFLGTMGFGYPDWEGEFYPSGMSSARYLSHYSQHFNAVEIDSTFYGTPRRTTIRRWGSLVPPGFRFCLKTPQQITHQRGLVKADVEMSEFSKVAMGLGENLGAILLQFPPSFGGENLGVLAEFLPVLSGGIRYAVEFRHPSWFVVPEGMEEPAVAALLRQHEVAWAATDYPGVPPRIYLTSDFLYIRWIGEHGAYERHTHERADLTDRLVSWSEALAAKGEQVGMLYGFFNNDYAGFAPATCNRFKKILGLTVSDFRPPQQGRLF